MTDITAAEHAEQYPIDPPEPKGPTRLQRLVARIERFIALNLQPQRALLYTTTVADVAVALFALSKNLDIQQVTLVVSAVIAVNAKVLAWIKGHQDMLQALYQRDLIAYQANTQADLHAQHRDAVAAASRPGGKTNGLTLSR